MRRERALLILAILTAVLPFIGIPLGWKKFFYIAIGALIVIATYAKKSIVKNKFETITKQREDEDDEEEN